MDKWRNIEGFYFFSHGSRTVSGEIITKLRSIIFHLAKLEFNLTIMSRIGADWNRLPMTETPCIMKNLYFSQTDALDNQNNPKRCATGVWGHRWVERSFEAFGSYNIQAHTPHTDQGRLNVKGHCTTHHCESIGGRVLHYINGGFQ